MGPLAPLPGISPPQQDNAPSSLSTWHPSKPPEAQIRSFVAFIRRKYPREDFKDVKEALIHADYDLYTIRHEMTKEDWKDLGLAQGKFERMKRYLKAYKRSPEFLRSNKASEASSTASEHEVEEEEL